MFEAAKTAAQKDDFKTFFTCLTPDSQKVMAGQMVLGGMAMKSFAEMDKTGKAKEAFKPLDELFKKHGLTEEALKKFKPTTDPKEAAKNIRAMGDLIKDRPAFCTEFMGFLQKGGKRGPAPLSDATLTDVKIEGDKASGTLLTKKGGKETKEPVEFAKIKGGWRLVAPEPKANPRLPAPKSP